MWDSLTDEEKVAQVRHEVEAQRFKAHDWEEALDQVVEEKNRLWDALNNITALWVIEAPMSEIENAMERGKIVLGNTRVVDS